MTGQLEYAELMQPLSSDAPCGADLEDSQLLASFDAFRLFGQMMPLTPAPDWRAIEEKSRQALEKSKDFRLLAHLSAATLRTKGLFSFLGTLNVAAHWLEQYWDHVFPRIDEDAILRKNALNAFADRIAIIDGVRRHPIVRHSQLGSFSLRDIDIAMGRAPLPAGEQAPDAAHVHAAFAANSIEELRTLSGAAATALDALRRVDAKVRETVGSEATPDFDPLTNQLTQMGRVLNEALARHPEREASDGAQERSSGALEFAESRRSAAPSAINSRQDAIRALEAVAAYFRQHEPSSPIPIFIDRSIRLVGKNFLEVLNDVAPDGLSQARNAGGVRSE
jgi:type VI secretion system protein ImpA